MQMGETHMCHQFFNQPPVQPLFRPFIAKTYDLKIEPNASFQGNPVQTDEDGTIVAAHFDGGESVRNHHQYLIVRTNTMNWFADRHHVFHPLD